VLRFGKDDDSSMGVVMEGMMGGFQAPFDAGTCRCPPVSPDFSEDDEVRFLSYQVSEECMFSAESGLEFAPHATNILRSNGDGRLCLSVPCHCQGECPLEREKGLSAVKQGGEDVKENCSIKQNEKKEGINETLRPWVTNKLSEVGATYTLEFIICRLRC